MAGFRRRGVTRLAERQTRFLSVAQLQVCGLPGGEKIGCAKSSIQQCFDARETFFTREVFCNVPGIVAKDEGESLTRAQCDRAHNHVLQRIIRATRTAQGQLRECPVADGGGEQCDQSLFGIRRRHARMIVHAVVHDKPRRRVEARSHERVRRRAQVLPASCRQCFLRLVCRQDAGSTLRLMESLVPLSRTD